jgi:hypothetical protein
MSNIQKRLENLKPYIIGMRLVDGIPIVDVRLKEGWVVPDSKVISKEVGEKDKNYYMFYCEKPEIGIDELLDYAEAVIAANKDRERKQELLTIKITELKILFKGTSLAKLQNLKFVLEEEGDENNLTDEIKVNEPIVNEEPKEEIKEPVVEPAVIEEPAPLVHPKIQRSPVFKAHQKVELPPKGKVVLEDFQSADTEGECNCGPDEACSRCIGKKDL